MARQVIKVKTTYKGTVAVADHIVKEKITSGMDLVVSVKEELMVIPNAQIAQSCVGKSDIFHDQYGRGDYRLLYFKWVPSIPRLFAI